MEESKFEKNLTKKLVEQIKDNDDFPKRTLALYACWMYFKSVDRYIQV